MYLNAFRSDNMQITDLSGPSDIAVLTADEVNTVNGGNIYRIAGSIAGGILYKIAREVAENGGPPLPNMGFH
jgi:hypothetical protein